MAKLYVKRSRLLFSVSGKIKSSSQGESIFHSVHTPVTDPTQCFGLEQQQKLCMAGNYQAQLAHSKYFGGCVPQVTKSSERRLTHLTKASDELGKLEDEMSKFKTWMSAANSELARQEECLQRFEDLKPLAEKQKVSRVGLGWLVGCPASSNVALSHYSADLTSSGFHHKTSLSCLGESTLANNNF